jgi:hypothetical protein
VFINFFILNINLLLGNGEYIFLKFLLSLLQVEIKNETSEEEDFSYVNDYQDDFFDEQMLINTALATKIPTLKIKKEKNRSPKNKSPKKTIKTYTCEVCSDIFHKKKDYFAHMKIHDQVSFLLICIETLY